MINAIFFVFTEDLPNFEEVWASDKGPKHDVLLPPSESLEDNSDGKVFSKIFKMKWK